MSSRQKLEQAIVTLEAQRAVLGDDVVEMAVAVLHEKLASLQGHPAVAQHEQTAVLVADLSGFTALSEWRDAEEVRDTINAVWQKLDSVVESWGGTIDKHVGDGVIALFGVPVAGDDDPEWAIQAALDMQMELALFNEQTTQEVTQGQFSWPALPAELRMRIGIHIGPVFLGKVGASGEYTAVGDTVNVAHQLERLAPVGGILISHALYQHVHTFFDVQPLELSLLDGTQESDRFYVVKRDRPGAIRLTIGGTEGVTDGTSATRLVGRTEELQRLQEALQTTIESGVAQVVTIIGEAGVGKSRLLLEFERLLALLPEQVCLFKGHKAMGHQVVSPSPYALVRDLFVNYFDIHPRNSAAVAREKLVRGVLDVLGNQRLGNQRLGNLPSREEGSRARERAHFIGHLLGFDFAGSPYLQGIRDEVRRMREYGFQDIAHFFRAVAEDYPAAVIFLEDIHWADEGSFDLIDYLVQECRHVPLLVVCLARPSLFDKRPSWRLVESLDTVIYRRLELPPLSAIDSRHLLADILHHVANVPLKLGDLIVNSAGGIPFYVEEMVKMLVEEGVIVEGPERWRVDMTKLADSQVPPTPVTLLQTRLSRLAAPERSILEKAAVVGHVFWNTLLLQLGQTGDVAISATQLESVLRRLEEKEWIVRRQPGLSAGPESILSPRREQGMTTFAGAREYVFRHDSLREVIYGTISDSRRRQYHAQAAAWFIAYGNGDDNDHGNQNVDSAVGYAGIIARHFEQAEDYDQAATWYGWAARQAESNYAPETAIYYYCQALNLLPAQATGQPTAFQRVALNEGLGEMLRWQARFSDAVDAFKAMLDPARAIEDAAAEGRALLGLFWAYACQGQYGAALDCAGQAELVARSARSGPSLASALAAKGWALLSLGDVNAAIQAGKEALTVSHVPSAASELAQSEGHLAAFSASSESSKEGTAAVAPREVAYSNMLLGEIGRVSGHYGKAVEHTEKALHIFRGLGDRLWQGLVLAQLARIAQARGDEAIAIARYRESLRIARNIGDYYGTLLALRQLGRLAWLQDDYAQAEEQYQQALVFAEKCGNIEYRTALANDLGELHLAWAISIPAMVDVAGRDDHWQQAYAWFKRALRLAHEADRPRSLVTAQTGLARLHLEDEQPYEAQRYIQEAIAQAERALQDQPGVAVANLRLPNQRLQKELAAARRVAGLIAARLQKND